MWGCDMYVPFIYMEDGHAEEGYYADNDGGDDDANDNGHVTAIDG